MSDKDATLQIKNLYNPPGELLKKATLSFSKLKKCIEVAPCGNDSLISGKLGLVLYYFTLYEALGNKKYAAKGRLLLEEVFEKVNSGESNLLNPSLSKGLCGFLYLNNYLSKKGLIDIDVEEEFSVLEEYLLHQSQYMISNKFNDYLHGGFGTLFYFLTRLPDDSVVDHIMKMIDTIFENSVETENSFWLRNFLSSVEEKKEINFSLSHGQASFFQILIMAFQQGIYPEKIYLAVKKGIDLVLRNMQEVDFEKKNYSFFAFNTHEKTGDQVFKNRMAWCYGDLNQVLLLYKAGYAFDEVKMTDLATMIGSATISRQSVEETACNDAHFCHGAAGIAQVYRTLFNTTGLDIYKKAYYSWIEKTIDYVEKDLQKNLYGGKEVSLLEGLPGVALTLLSFISHKELEWSKLFLL